MRKWIYQKGVDAATGKHFIYDADGETTSGEWIGEACDEEKSKQIVREHNAHDELVHCLSEVLKVTCGDCRRGERMVAINGLEPCGATKRQCNLAMRAHAAVAAVDGES